VRVLARALALLLLIPAAACRRPEVAHRPLGEAGSASAKVDSAARTLPMPDLGYNAREGRAIFDHYCSTCHGAEGHGDGFNAFNLDPRPRDLGDPVFQKKRNDAELAAVIRSGGLSAGLSSGMPPWGRTLTTRQIGNLIAYLRTLRPAEP
jgi:mono/diheme cytochrome c family protein